MTIEFPKKAKEKITAPIPAQLIKEREGGGKKMLSYISGSTVTDLLNSAFGYLWSWETNKEWVQESIPCFNQYSKLPEKVMHNGKNGAWENQGPVANVKGTLTVYIETPSGQIIEIKKTGYGSKSVLGKQNDQESIFKAAGTDALKKAASLFGIGLELYRDEDEQEYFYEMNFEDPWTDEMLEKYKGQRDFIKQVISEYEMESDGLNAYVEEFSGGSLTDIGQIIPDNIDAFTQYLKAKIDSGGEE